MLRIRPVKIALICFLATALMFSSFFRMESYAAVPKLEQIRVALFIKPRGTVPAVTLSASETLKLGLRKPDGVSHWFDAGQSLRISADQYMLRVTETADLQYAGSLAAKYNGSNDQAFIIMREKSGKTVYQVYIGHYSTYDEAKNARERVINDAAIRGSVQNAEIKITGPFHWSAGEYATRQEAEQRQGELNKQGLEAQLALYENQEGKPTYSVWLGGAPNQTDLDLVKNEALKAVPDLQLFTVNRNVPYLLLRKDVSTGGNPVHHYFFNENGQKVWVTTAAQTGIKVQERFGRSYRGNMELSQYDGKLALVNELPFEQYLYSVVGSELDAIWPKEALKAQAVAARTFALTGGMKYKIAHISDTTYDQAYKGIGREFPGSIQAVDETKGEVLVNQKGLITPFYSSNTGGMSASPEEVWGNPVEYVAMIPSPDDIAQAGKLLWNRIVLPDGQAAYVRSDLMKATGEINEAGLPYYEAVGTNINVRLAPYVDNESNPAVAQINTGDRFVVFEQTMESNAYQWVRGPYKSNELLQVMNKHINPPVQGSLSRLEVSNRGPSGRVLEMNANGKTLKITPPDAYRTVLNGLPSTRFDIEETGAFTVLGAGGRTSSMPESKNDLYVLYSAEGTAVGEQAAPVSPYMFFLNNEGEIRYASKSPEFRFLGFGFGHGMGMSQWGAKAWAELGYDYRYILQYYYKDVRIVKE
jgi:stage II sporulation protein D